MASPSTEVAATAYKRRHWLHSYNFLGSPRSHAGRSTRHYTAIYMEYTAPVLHQKFLLNKTPHHHAACPFHSIVLIDTWARPVWKLYSSRDNSLSFDCPLPHSQPIAQPSQKRLRTHWSAKMLGRIDTTTTFVRAFMNVHASGLPPPFSYYPKRQPFHP